MGGIVGSIFGDGGDDERDAANAAGEAGLAFRQKAADLWDDLQVPNLTYSPYLGYTVVGDLTPETYDPWIGQVTQMSDDPDARRSQMEALARLERLGAGGLTDSDRIALNQIGQKQLGAVGQGVRAAVDNLQARGLGGAGTELAARLAANQTAANASSDLYDSAFKAALDRAANANVAAGNLATNVRGQTAGISKQMADINNQFNQQVQQLRTNAAKDAASARNQAQLLNLQNRQSIANRNVDVGNQNLDRQNQLTQQNFANQQSKIRGQSDAYNGVSGAQFANQAALNQQAYGDQQGQTNDLLSIAKLGAMFFL